ncbi:MAG: hypothetical protein JNK72_25510 [Myxococcales bacterium]|nr:hypothetical protein [Myxococcales bacterium]
MTLSLPVSLAETTLGDLLATCYRAHIDGTLCIVEVSAEHKVHLRKGQVLAVECARPTPRFGDVVVAAGVSARAVVEEAQSDGQRRGWRIGQSLVGHRVLSPNERDRVLDAQRAHRLANLFLVREGRVALGSMQTLPPGAAERPPMEPGSVFYGRPRARDGLTAEASAWGLGD